MCAAASCPVVLVPPAQMLALKFIELLIGQFIERKNPLLLLKAFDLLRDQPLLKCLFVGDGPLREELRAAIRVRGLEDRCRVIAFQPDVGPVLRAIDVLVLPSRQESLQKTTQLRSLAADWSSHFSVSWCTELIIFTCNEVPSMLG